MASRNPVQHWFEAAALRLPPSASGRTAAWNKAFQAGIIIFIVASLLAVLLAKVVAYESSTHTLLYIYGVLVTAVVLLTLVVAFTRYRDPYQLSLAVPAALKRRYKVSCMVAVRNEERLIEQCILSLVNQTYTDQEIIFVNDASTDGTGAILDLWAGRGLISVIHLKKNVGKKRALAQAMLQAKGEIFAFTDSDSVLAPDAIAKMVDVFGSDPDIGAVGGHCRASNGDKNLVTKIQDSWYEGQFSVRKAFESVFGAVTCVSGPLAVFRKEAIFNYIPAWEGDTFLGQEFRFSTDRTLTSFVLGGKVIGDKLKRKYAASPFVTQVDYPARYWKVVYCKSAKAFTAVPDTFRKMVRQQVRWKKSFIRSIFFTGAFYWRKPLLPALVYYLHIIFVLAGPFVAFRHLIYLPFKGDIISMFLYLAGVAFVGFTFGLAYRLETQGCRKWMYRPLMSLLSTLVFSWLIFYSAATIKKMVWAGR